jgi:Tol biopolymer transport system component
MGTPGFSADGTTIAFASSRTGNGDIYVMNANGSGQTRRTTSAAIDSSPDWSGAGTKIAFASRRDSNFEIYSMNTDGSGQTRLTTNPAADISPDAP